MSSTVEITLATDASSRDIEAALDALGDLGAWALDLSDSTPPVLRALVPIEPEPARAVALQAFDAIGIRPLEITARRAATVDWGSGWRDALKATQVGPLWVVPTGRAAPASAERVITIDALVAFGSGTHETTLLCLEKIVELSPIDRLLDVGTGSGILSIAALALGGGQAIGTDREPQALRAAAENARRNAVADRFTLLGEDPDQLGQFEVVLANILAATLVDIAPKLVRAVAPKGRLILSGVRLDQREEVARAYKGLGLRDLGGDCRGDWLRMDLEASW